MCNIAARHIVLIKSCFVWTYRTLVRMDSKLIRFFMTVGQLKKTKRAGWVLQGIENPEYVSGHMYRMAIMAMTCKDPTKSLKIDRCIKLCLVHDMAESIVGDITPKDNVPKEEKYKMEKNAMQELGSLLDTEIGAEINDLFQEFEDQETPEAKFVKDLDQFDMILQAYQYEKEANNIGWLQEFFDSVQGKFKTSQVKELAENLIVTRKNETKDS